MRKPDERTFMSNMKGQSCRSLEADIGLVVLSDLAHNLRNRSSVDFWYLRISRSATVPGLYLCGFLRPPQAGADMRAALVASCLRGACPPVDFRAVCLVLAMNK